MTEHATTGAAPNAADLFEIIRTIWSMRRLKPEPVPNQLIPKILETGDQLVTLAKQMLKFPAKQGLYREVHRSGLSGASTAAKNGI